MSYTFFKHGLKWRYRKHNDVAANDIDTKALEEVLGVVGGPHVIVVRECLVERKLLHIHVKNGFIDCAVAYTPGERMPLPIHRFTINDLDNS